MKNPLTGSLQACSVCTGPAPWGVIIVWATGPFPLCRSLSFSDYPVSPLWILSFMPAGPLSYAYRPFVLCLRALHFMVTFPEIEHRDAANRIDAKDVKPPSSEPSFFNSPSRQFFSGGPQPVTFSLARCWLRAPSSHLQALCPCQAGVHPLPPRMSTQTARSSKHCHTSMLQPFAKGGPAHFNPFVSLSCVNNTQAHSSPAL